MTERTNLDVAAECFIDIGQPREMARAALDAIHPALAHLTPDDVAQLFRVARKAWDMLGAHLQGPSIIRPVVWEVLSRD